MNVKDAFPSNYLKSTDVMPSLTLVMDKAEMQKLNDEDKLVLSFRNSKKSMVVNKTNSKAITAKFGEETADWAGNSITLVSAQIEFQGKTVSGIRVQPPSSAELIGEPKLGPELTGGVYKIPKKKKAAPSTAADPNDAIGI